MGIRSLVIAALLSALLVSGCAAKPDSKKSEKPPSKATASQSTSVPPEAPQSTTPPPKGSKLETITQPPGPTLAMIEKDVATEGAQYKVTFSPFGAAAQDPDGQRYVIAIAKAQPLGKGAKPYDLNGRNVLVTLAAGSKPFPDRGGEFKGVVKLVEQQGLLVPELKVLD